MVEQRGHHLWLTHKTQKRNFCNVKRILDLDLRMATELLESKRWIKKCPNMAPEAQRSLRNETERTILL